MKTGVRCRSMSGSMHSPAYVARMRATLQFVVHDVLRMSNADFARALGDRLGSPKRPDQISRWLNSEGMENVPYADVYHAVLEMAGVDLSPEGILRPDNLNAQLMRRLANLEDVVRAGAQADVAERDEARKLIDLPHAVGDPKDFVSVPEAARREGVTEQAIRLRIARGRLKAFRRGRKRVVRLSDLGSSQPSS